MAGSVRGGPGGIQGLCRLLTEHGEAVEYDLLRLGLRLEWLGTKRLTWRDLLVIIRQAPFDSAVTKATAGMSAEFGVTDRLLMLVELRIRQLMWGMSDRKTAEPTILAIPGEEQPQSESGNRFVGDPMTIEQMNAYLGW